MLFTCGFGKFNLFDCDLGVGGGNNSENDSDLPPKHPFSTLPMA
jgi:hypothetical protein